MKYKKWYWANKESIAFLNEGYLQNGQTVQERVREIAVAAEKHIGKPGWAEKFEERIALGWASLASPVWANYGTQRGLPISCVTPDTWINIQGLGGKQAKDIAVGDMVLTHKGRYRPVTNIIVTKNREDIFSLKVNGRMTRINLTGNHPVLTNLGWVRTDELNPDKHLVATNGDIEYTPVDSVIDFSKTMNEKFIVSDGLVKKPLTKKNQSKLGKQYSDNYANIKNSIAIDEELAWALGLWFAEGSLTRNGKTMSGIRITLAPDEEAIGDKWLSIMETKFNIKGGKYEGKANRPDAPKTKKSRWWTYTLHSNVIGDFFASFGNGCKEKIIPQNWTNLPIEKLKCLMNGVLLGDGSVRKNSCKLTLANPKLLLQVYEIGLKLGMEMSLQMQDKPSIYGKTAFVYTIVFRNYKLTRSVNHAAAGIRFNDGLIYAPIIEHKKTDMVSDVYDFTVEEDHSFSASGVILHNCNGSWIPDSIEGMATKNSELAIMTKNGAGTSAYMGAIRPKGSPISTGGKTDGVMHFIEWIDKTIKTIAQGNTRRGAIAYYLPIEHPEFEDFLKINSQGSNIQKTSLGVCISDDFMLKLKERDEMAIHKWKHLIEKRFNSGYPYIFFSDNANKAAPQVYKDKGMKIHHSNLCSEIFLSNSEEESFVCCLSSLNLLHYDDWKDTDWVEMMTEFLDAVIEEYIHKTKNLKHMEAAHRFAVRQRAIGLGVLGWHSLLQRKMIAFESFEAKMLNTQIFKLIDMKSLVASKEMAVRLGEPELLKGYGERNVTRIAIAPTTSSSFILGQVSPSIEPLRDNYFVKDLAKTSHSHRNPALQDLLADKDMNTNEVWMSILKHGGSVQHLDFLTAHEKNVFKTFSEISQKEIIIQAAMRQRYIDQGQSLNILVNNDTTAGEISYLQRFAHYMGIKSMYYQRGANPAQALARSIITCKSCEG